MQKIEKSPGEVLEELAGAYGSKSELARSIGVSRSTLYRWLKKDSIPNRFGRKISRRRRYFEREVPRREISRLKNLPDKIRRAKELDVSISMNDLMPEGYSIFAFNLVDHLYNDIQMKYVRLAWDIGVHLYGFITQQITEGAMSDYGVVDERRYRISDMRNSAELYKVLRSLVITVGSDIAARYIIIGTGRGIEL